MKIWSRFPVFRFLIPFSIGILIAIHYQDWIRCFISIAASGLILSILFTVKNYASGKYAQRWLAGIPFYWCFAGLGFVVTWFHESIRYKDHFSQDSEVISSQLYVVTLAEPPALSTKGFRITASVDARKDSNGWVATRGKLLIYLNDSLRKGEYHIGDKCVLYGQPFKVTSSGNPGAFDYSQYLKGKGVYHQAYVKNDKFALLQNGDSQSMYALAVMLRDLLLEKLKKFIHDPDELGVAGALLLGYEDWLDPDLELSYTGAGVLHVLCVSGMHVGLIYAVLAYLLSFMENKKWLRPIMFTLLLFFLWFYALVTGFSPSVVRASAMFTFVVMGKWLNREANIYNLLCSSCILLFAMNPFLIMSAGFQLSFLAVCGIVFIHKMILPIFKVSNRFLFMIWELISISIAAQITTVPLSLLLFHQFPNYFLIGNLLIIPLSTLVMYSGLIFLLTDWIPYLGWFVGYCTTIGISWLNSLVVFIGNLPGAVTENCFISFAEMCCLYGIMLFFILWIIHKMRSLLFTWMAILICFLGFRISLLTEASIESSLTVYNSGNHTLISIIHNRITTILADSSCPQKTILSAAKEHLLSNMVIMRKDVFIQPNSITFIKTNNEIAIAHVKDWDQIALHESAKPFKENNVLVLGGNLNFKASDLLKTIQPETIIFDASCKSFQVKKLEVEFQLLGIKTHDVKKQGAYQLYNSNAAERKGIIHADALFGLFK
jgi:competence protein ComEC